MAIPSRRETLGLLLAFQPPPWFLAHVSAVAEIASFLAARLAGRGLAVERPLVESAALLHDIDKLFPAHDPLSALGHGDAGARWLADHGYAELSRAVASHPVTRLSDQERYAPWAAFASREERIVCYADKRAAQRLISLAARFADWERRSPEHRPQLALARRRAEHLEREVCGAAGISATEVRRLPWVRGALRAARPGAAAASGASR